MAEEIIQPVQQQAPTLDIQALESLKSFGGMLSESTMSELEKVVPVTPVIETQQQTPVQPVVVQPVVEQEKKIETPAQTNEYQSPFGFNKKKEAAKEVKIENIDQALEYIKTSYGQELKSVADLPKFLDGSVNKWRNDSQKLTVAEKTLGDYKTLFENQPKGIIEAMKLHAAGHDYTEAFKKPKLDYDTPPEKLDKFKLVDTYFPGKFSKEDFEVAEGTELPITTQAIIQAATEKFTNEKKSIVDERAAAELKASQQYEAFKTSVSGSVESLKTQFPDADLQNITEIESILSGGVNSVFEQFFNPNGTLKPEAAENLMWMKHGKQEITNMMNYAAKVSESKTNEDLLTRGADTKKPVQRNGGVETLPLDLKAMFDGLEALKKKKTFV